MLLQEIWRSNIEWDATISDDHYEKWLLWIKVLSQVEKIRVPRCYFYNNRTASSLPQLHVFVDASEYAYAAVAYFRMEYNDDISCSLVAAKTKVAPQKPLSIPRMELQAAVLGTRLATTICNGHPPISKRYIWSDSRTVLCWLKADPRRFHQFVSLRIGEILESTEISEWRWIATKENVADEATKWQGVPDMSHNSRWFAGPPFLKQHESSWPSDDNVRKAEATEEIRTHLAHFTQNETTLTVDESRFSNYQRLLRSQAFFLRAVNKFLAKLKKTEVTAGKITRIEYEEAENCLIRKAQYDQFNHEILSYLLQD